MLLMSEAFLQAPDTYLFWVTLIRARKYENNLQLTQGSESPPMCKKSLGFSFFEPSRNPGGLFQRKLLSKPFLKFFLLGNKTEKSELNWDLKSK